MSTTYIIGAGLAGLSAACELAASGDSVVLYESGPAAGGRCRSYFDRGLGCRIDNGNHLLLSGNTATMAFLDRIGTRHSLGGPGEPHFPFLDLGRGANWTLAPGLGRIPWWILRRASRVPGTQPWHYLALLALRRAAEEATIAATLGGAGELYRCLLEPLSIAALNTRPDSALARLLYAVIRETLMLGGAACIPSFPRIGLSESFIDPAIGWLRARGGGIFLGRRAVALGIHGDNVTAVHLLDETISLHAGDRVVLAVPAWVAADLLPGLGPPDAFEAIVNVHFRTGAQAPAGWRHAGFVGLIGGTAEWVFAKPGIVSVTISAANHLVDLAAADLAARAWEDARRALGVEGAMPPVRVVKERRATFAATAAQERRRPGPRTGLRNLVLAGDWTATGLPATIEGAIRSGRAAAEALRAA
jgi:squalene-associated FAD-dependent desaturase